ncbi:putative alkylated DNA repair protein [Rickettsia endosymbiont of Ixodes pacificus]|nr:putative alkylated DNA repair protein [Rickettsia endosymbiont of Ixodes pacificus]
MPGQGIASHIDCIPCFSDTICSLSLSGGCVMELTNYKEKRFIALQPRSLLILKNEARYK